MNIKGVLEDTNILGEPFKFSELSEQKTVRILRIFRTFKTFESFKLLEFSNLQESFNLKLYQTCIF